TEGLPPIIERYGPALEIAGVNTATTGGQSLFRAAIEALAIPPAQVGVPTLVVGSEVLVGSYEIPTRLPGIVEAGLAGDGVDWPRVPLLRRALAAQGLLVEDAGPEPVGAGAGAGEGAEATDEPPSPGPREVATEPESAAGTAAPGGMADGAGPVARAATDSALADAVTGGGRAAMAHGLTLRERLMLDPAGNATALAVLVLMLAALGLVAAGRAGRVRVPDPPVWLIPALAVLGIAVAGYLAYIEATGGEAICGPVGDCNTVQQSPYARILGVPVGVLGVLGYGVMLATWIAGRASDGMTAGRARVVLWWLALGATLFSVYLTFLEPFVIGASCAWCLTSAAATTAILVAATGWRRSVGVSPTPRPSVSH
ncbi:MAG: vitamin K epoxide reductase family protein, partial [Candidatus Longimicrobiales bacterium M2_2A_002]